MTQEPRFPSSESDASRNRPLGARWIVSEPTGRWAIALRREAGAEGPRLFETRSLADAWSMLERFPASFLVAELTSGGAGALLDAMARLGSTFPKARIAVVADRALSDWEWLAREAGAAWFAASPREVRPIVAIARRHLHLAPAAGDFLEELWNLLPWKPADEQ